MTTKVTGFLVAALVAGIAWATAGYVPTGRAQAPTTSTLATVTPTSTPATIALALTPGTFDAQVPEVAGFTYTPTPATPLPWLQLDLPTTVSGYAFGVVQAGTSIGSIVVLDGLDIAAYVNRLFDEPVQLQRDAGQVATGTMVLTTDARAAWRSVNGIPVVAATLPDADVAEWVWSHGGHAWIATGRMMMEGFVGGLVAAQQAALPGGTHDYELLGGGLYDRLVHIRPYLYIDLPVAEALEQLPQSLAGDCAQEFFLGYIVHETDPDPLTMAADDLGVMAATIGGVCVAGGFFAELDSDLDGLGMRDDMIAGFAVRRDDASIVFVSGDYVFHLFGNPAVFATMDPFITGLLTSFGTPTSIVPPSVSVPPTSLPPPTVPPPPSVTLAPATPAPSSSSVTVGSAAIPPATQQPTGLGDDPTFNLLAQACFDGDMASCDELYKQSPAGSAYEQYGDTCAGRQPSGTGKYCVDVFGFTASG